MRHSVFHIHEVRVSLKKGVRGEFASFQESETVLSKDNEHNPLLTWNKSMHKLDVALKEFEKFYGHEKTNELVVFLNNMTQSDREEMQVLYNFDSEALIEIMQTKIKEVPNT